MKDVAYCKYHYTLNCQVCKEQRDSEQLREAIQKYNRLRKTVIRDFGFEVLDALEAKE